MVNGNLNYFYNVLAIAPSAWAISYDFSSPIGSGLNVPSVMSGNSLYSGQLSSIGNYYQTSGSGYFTGQSININNASGLSFNSFTTLFVTEKTGTGNGILFSSLQSGVNISGFIIGYSDTNRLYFETYDGGGPRVYMSSNIYGSKNAIAIVKSNNVLNFHYYNFNEQVVESESFNISSTALYNSNQVYLAATGAGTPQYITQSPFSGYLSQFCYFNLSLTQNTVQKLFSGIYCNKNPNTTGVLGYSSGVGFTGANVVYTGIGTGITGQQIYLAGTFVDSCGAPHNLFSYNNLTGIISGYTFYPISGAIVIVNTGIIDNGYLIDTGFANSFGMDGFAYNTYVAPTDFTEFYHTPFILNTGLNNLAVYSLDGTFKLNQNSANNQFNLYVNGVANFPSGYAYTGTVYVQVLTLSGDYYTSGQSIVSTGLYQSNDIVIYDYITGVNELFYYTGGVQTFSSNYPNNRMIFLNGQKLISGSGYTFAANNLQINLPITGSGIISNFPTYTGFTENSGFMNHLITNKFSRDASQVWLNGIRQDINNDYFEISKVDLLNGAGSFQIYPNILFNNQTNFYQPF